MEEDRDINVYKHIVSNHYYKLRQRFADFDYYDCFMNNCNGRLRVEKSITKTVNSHNHGLKVAENLVQLKKLNKVIVQMALEDSNKNLNPLKIYRLAIEKMHGIMIPVNYKQQQLKCIRNARYRIKSRKTTNSGNTR